MLSKYTLYAHGPKINNETSMALHNRGKKENRTKKKNEHGDICFLINYKFPCKISFKRISFLFLLLHYVTLFILDSNDFLALMSLTK